MIKRNENPNSPAQKAVFSRGGGGMGRQGQAVMSQKVAGTEGSGGGGWQGGKLPTFLPLVTITSWLNLEGDEGWEDAAHVRFLGGATCHFCGRRKHLDRPDGSATNTSLRWPGPLLVKSGRCQWHGSGARGRPLGFSVGLSFSSIFHRTWSHHSHMFWL